MKCSASLKELIIYGFIAIMIYIRMVKMLPVLKSLSENSIKMMEKLSMFQHIPEKNITAAVRMQVKIGPRQHC